MGTYEHQTVVITGAGQGIGRAVAAAYAAEGANVVIAEVKEETGRKAAEEIRQTGGIAEFISCDVSDEKQIIRMVEFAAERFGSIHILINNAGIADAHTASFYELTAEAWDKVMDTNVRGMFLATREAAKLMRNNPDGGAVVNLSSTRAHMSESDTEAYAASKGAIAALTHAMAVTLGPDKITVNCISPGWIETGEYGQLREIDHIQHPSGRVGKPEDIARACLYLTAPGNDFVTGAELVIDGGMTRKMIYEP
ncbi:SDR family NAD(P)-dependent oxidoreductase [Paenibacillus tengchongensis]|uniref:SDR family NAD(P)-dependent oxidoreductase n=1 Tax=Paenibacillus tengchongensis TaxID=2608684 RepID=UPI00124DD2A0|nr:glucose 1-dehydrogenase [Paenibacillus tengchongensis]